MLGVKCPSCRAEDTKVIDSRVAEDGATIRRRRACPQCAYRFTTFERLEELPFFVIKSDGSREPFNRLKVLGGLQAASKGRPVAAEQLVCLAESVEDEARMRGSEVQSTIVGMLALEQLRSVDEVAYLRFASVYKNFDAAADFVEEMHLMHKLKTTEPPESGSSAAAPVSGE
jgi:transcriptional repressor NrdR